jgi:hypothetical protein
LIDTKQRQSNATVKIFLKKIYYLFVKIIKRWGYAAQIIWNAAIRAVDHKPLKIEYIPIYKLGVNYDGENKVDGYWYSWLGKSCEIQITLYPKFTGKDNGKIWKFFTYVDQPQSLFFSDYLSGLYWASVEGELAAHYIILKNHWRYYHYHIGRINDKKATAEAEKVRKTLLVQITSKLL